MSITAVPLRPIRRGALAKLWVALALLVIVGVGVAIAQTPSPKVEALPDGIRIETVTAGIGPVATMADAVLVNYAGRFANGKTFDTNMGGQPAALPVAEMIPGFSEGLQHMQAGGHYRLFIPSRLGYGAQDVPDPSTGQVAIPGNSDLYFDILIRAVRPIPPQAMGGGMGAINGAPGGDPASGAAGAPSPQ